MVVKQATKVWNQLLRDFRSSLTAAPHPYRRNPEAKPATHVKYFFRAIKSLRNGELGLSVVINEEV